MSIVIEGWFVPAHQIDDFDGFWAARKEKEKRLIWNISYPFQNYVEPMCKTILFGGIHDRCNKICGDDHSYDCSQRTSSFCKKKSLNRTKDRYHDPNWYIVWDNMKDNLERTKKELSILIGEHRYQSFMEFLTYNAMERYKRYTRREIKEKGLREPQVVESAFIGLEEIQSDPWQVYINEQIQKGELGCSQHYSESELFAL